MEEGRAMNKKLDVAQFRQLYHPLFRILIMWIGQHNEEFVKGDSAQKWISNKKGIGGQWQDAFSEY